MAFDPNTIPDSLKQAYKDKRCAIFVGAGASMGAGLPGWESFLSSMISAAETHRTIDDTKATEYRSLLKDQSKYLMIAESLKHDMAMYFDDFLERKFKPSGISPTDLHKSITKATNFQFVITTNYDTLIERTYRSMGLDDVSVNIFSDTGEIQRSLSKREFFILKAHGDISRMGNGIILTENDYRTIIYKERGYQSLLSAMFTMFSIVFVGASMTDPDVKLLLSYISDIFSVTSGPSHFALLDEKKITQVEKERWLRDMRIQIIPISAENDYSELTEFVDALHLTSV